MKHYTNRGWLMASTMICGALALGAATSAAAQPAAPQEEVVVTGSRIPQPNLTSVSPITTVTDAQIKQQGTVNVEDFINNLPQVFAGQGQYLSNGASGTATVDLRNLGPSRTLVLIDGLRLQPGDPLLPVADLNMIPPGLIDHVELLTGGSSATYGSDAVAGVVNFIMKKHVQGLEIDAETSIAESSSNNGQVRAAAAEGLVHPSFGIAPPTLPDKNEWNGRRTAITITGGINSPDDKGNVEFYFGETTIDAVNQGTRDYSACSLATNTGDSAQYCGGSPTGAGVAFVPKTGPNANGGSQSGFGPGYYGPSAAVNSAANVFNFAPYNYFQRPDTRYTAGEFSTYHFNDHFNAYSSFMFMDDHTVAAIAPSGDFGGNAIIPCSDPLLTAAQHDTICGVGVTAGTQTVGVYHRNVEGGPRISDIEHMDYRIVVGLKGDIVDGWTYDLSGQYGRSVLNDNESGYLLNSKLTNALDVVSVGGVATCASVVAGTDKKCVPYNIWQPGMVTPAALAYLSGSAANGGATTEQIVTFSVAGDLGKYGIKSPWADKAVGVSAGLEYRAESLYTTFDSTFTSGDLAGGGGSSLPVNGTQTDRDVFGEVRVPIVQGVPFIKDLTFDGGYRSSDYSHGGETDAYKAGLQWAITSDLMLRGSIEHAVRAPNVQELFAPFVPGLVGGTDPCAGSHPKYSAALCLNTFANSLPGITLAQYTGGGYVLAGDPTPLGPLYKHVSGCAASQCSNFSGGNPDLVPEVAQTKTLGFVFTPTFFKGFSFSVDAFDIVVNKAILGLPANTLLNNCASLGNAYDCAQINRSLSSGFSLSSQDGTAYINQPTINASSLKTRGVDFDGEYRFQLHDIGLPELGSLSFSSTVTYVKDYIVVLADGTSYDCAGLYGVTCGAPTPHWRSTLRTTWNTPWNVSFTGSWRYTGTAALDFDTNVGDLQNGYKDTLPSDAHIKAYDYFDLAFNWRVRDKLSIRGGVNNIFDKTPPLVDTNSYGISGPPYGNGNTYPQVYDPLGRVLFLGLNAKF